MPENSHRTSSQRQPMLQHEIGLSLSLGGSESWSHHTWLADAGCLMCQHSCCCSLAAVVSVSFKQRNGNEQNFSQSPSAQKEKSQNCTHGKEFGLLRMTRKHDPRLLFVPFDSSTPVGLHCKSTHFLLRCTTGAFRESKFLEEDVYIAF